MVYLARGSSFPYFFWMEALIRMINKVVEGGFVTNFNIGSNGVLLISHIYSQMTLLSFVELLHLHCVLLCFEAVSDPKINFGRS